MQHHRQLKNTIRYLIATIMIGLALSGITAFPLETELRAITDLLSSSSSKNDITMWMIKVYHGLVETNAKFPFISYGTDWLAFAHLVIAVVFIGPLRDPVKNIWVVEFGIIACVGIFPLAFIAGHIRSIPLFWRLIDCSFGLIGGTLLIICYQCIKKLEKVSWQ